MFDPEPKALPCPECSTSLLEERRSGIMVDRCGSCRGIWFDRGELDAYRERRGEASGRSGEWGDRLASLPPTAASSCPRCETSTLRPGLGGEAWRSTCETCGGVWVPGGAVEILSASRPPGGEKGKKKGSYTLSDFLTDAILEFLVGW